MAKRMSLGRGLDALFDDNSIDTGEAGSLQTIRINDVEPNKEQPRDRFDAESLAELSESIKLNGLLQPIVVRSLAGGVYQIIAGERRWRASRMAGLTEIPALVIDASDDKVMELAMIENLQREDLTPLEEARGYRTLMERYSMTQEQVAQRLGKSRPVVANAVRLLELPEDIQIALEEGLITAGHARVLAGIPDGEQAAALCRDIVEKGMTVRQAEQASQKAKKQKTAAKPKVEQLTYAWGNNIQRETEISLQETLGRKVTIAPKGSGGTLTIEYFGADDLRELAARLAR